MDVIWLVLGGCAAIVLGLVDSPAWFWVAGGATLALGAGLVRALR